MLDRLRRGGAFLAALTLFLLFASQYVIAAPYPGAKTLVQGGQAAGDTNAQYPVVVGGTTVAGVNTILRTDANGALNVTGPAATGGLFTVVGPQADGAASASNPVQIAGIDGSGNVTAPIVATAADNSTLTRALRSHALLACYDGATFDLVRNYAQIEGAGSSGAAGVLGVGCALLEGTVVRQMRAANTAAGTTGTGLLGSGGMIWDATNWQKRSGATDGVAYCRDVRNTLTAVPVLTVGGAYTAGDCFGTKVTVSSASPVSGGVIYIDQVILTDKSDAAGNAFDILLWGTDPSSSTFTDNSAPSIDETTDLGNLSGVIHLVSGDFTDVGAAKAGTVAASHATANLPLAVKLAATSLYVVVLAQNTNSYTAGDVSIRLKVRQ